MKKVYIYIVYDARNKATTPIGKCHLYIMEEKPKVWVDWEGMNLLTKTYGKTIMEAKENAVKFLKTKNITFCDSGLHTNKSVKNAYTFSQTFQDFFNLIDNN